MILVSKCLLGENCKYNGGNNKNTDVIKRIEGEEYIAVCPEMLGGLACPRPPAEICFGSGADVLEKKARVVNKRGVDCTRQFLSGAEAVLNAAVKYGADKAIFKDGSPSCGVSYIYDGSFCGNRKKGCGVTTALLLKNNIKVISETEL